jgi:sec-independent protein translocase protein TatA
VRKALKIVYQRNQLGEWVDQMGSFSIWHWLIVLAVVLLLFGRGKIPDLMGDVAKGIKNFKSGMSDDDATAADESKTIDNQTGEPANSTKEKTTKS